MFRALLSVALTAGIIAVLNKMNVHIGDATVYLAIGVGAVALVFGGEWFIKKKIKKRRSNGKANSA